MSSETAQQSILNRLSGTDIGFSNNLVLSIGLLITIYMWVLIFKINIMIGNPEENPNIKRTSEGPNLLLR